MPQWSGRLLAGYRFYVDRLQDVALLDMCYLLSYPGQDNAIATPDSKLRAAISKLVAKAQRTDTRNLLFEASWRG
jgi:hypothetical protein